MAANIGFCSFSTEDDRIVQYLTSTTPQNELLGFPKADTVTHSYRRQGIRQFMQTSISGIVQARHLDFGRSTAGYQQYLRAFEKLTLQQVDTLIAYFPSLQSIINGLKLPDPDYLQSVIETRGDDLGRELLGNEEFSSKQLAKYVLVVQAHSAQNKPGEWITPLDTEFHAEVKIIADDLHSALGPKFDQALNAVIADSYAEELKNEIQSTLEQYSQFKYMLIKNR